MSFQQRRKSSTAAPGAKNPQRSPGPEPETTEALLQLFDKNIAAFRAALAGTTDQQLQESWTLMGGGKPFFSQPRWLVLRTYILNHAVHHRAQMGVYLWRNAIDVPAIYNDSADEKGGMFR